MLNPFRKRKPAPKKKPVAKKKPTTRKKPTPKVDPLDWFAKGGFATISDPYKINPPLTVNGLQNTLNALRQQEQDAIRRAQYQQYQNAAQMRNQLQSLLAQKGAGGSNLANALQGIPGATWPARQAPPNKKMNPPQFLAGYRVTVRTGRTVWTVIRWREESDPYRGMIRIYELENDKGQLARELEEDLNIHDGKGSTKAGVDFDTVIIADEKRLQILEALEQVNQYELIFEKWGFGETIEKGKGVSMLFYGPPGPGKTLMAQAIANKLGYVLKVISTADIESSAPGEAERNIRKHFADAKNGKTILLFDECDSLIFTRENVGPILSAQINELLSQIERFDGITLFTTNRLGTLDEAVNRRLALKLEFAMPTQEERAEIWRRMFPSQAPIAKDVDFMRLAIIEITGGFIKNAVLRAARMAAAEKIPDTQKEIKMDHLVRALKLETESMVEFENAREEHRGGIGQSVGVGADRKVVRKRDLKKVSGGPQ